jgi:L-ascorbate metabolism protein UlaG (beta-lactamase superfamily)
MMSNGEIHGHQEFSGMLEGVRHCCQSTVIIEREKIVYVDPFKIEGNPADADVILCTHDHFDHLSVKDIERIMKETTVLVVPKKAAKKFKKFPVAEVIGVVPFEEHQLEGLAFKTVPAYNIKKFFHPKRKKWVGYILQIEGAAYYFAGDTDHIPEMADIETDVAFLPVGGKYTMDALEAAEAANTIGPKVAVPIHFADVVGTPEDAQTFVQHLNDPIAGIILKT